MKTPPLRLHIISHTHWDREWYLTREHFREMLVRMINELIEILDSTPEFACFVLDGQTVILEDYLQLLPEKEAVLKRLIQEGRLVVGPWYIAADVFCVSGESLVRNLQKGMAMADAFGQCQKVGYMIDQFGFNSQMPQILAGFNINTAIAWRGVHQSEREQTDAVYWSSPDGSVVLLACLPAEEGYFNASQLSKDFEESFRIIDKCVESLKGQSNTGDILVMNGVDHAFSLREIPAIVKKYNDLHPDIEIQQNKPENYLSRIAGFTNRPKLTGELRNSILNDIMRGIPSVRMDIKIRNEQAERSLNHEAEPLSVMAEIFTGRKYDAPLLDEAWRLLLLNHAHDSIGGCSIDQVHKEMFDRFDRSLQISKLQSEMAMYRMAENITYPEETDCGVVVFNPTGFDRTDLCISELLIPQGKGEEEKRFKLFDGDREVDYCILHRRPREVKYNHYKKTFDTVTPMTVAFPVEKAPAFGYKGLSLERVGPDSKKKNITENIQPPVKIEGEYLTLQINQDATLNILDKRTGIDYHGLNRFIDDGDRGDTYNFCPPENDKRFQSKGDNLRIECLHDDDLFSCYLVSQEFHVPEKLSSDRRVRQNKLTRLPVSFRIMFLKQGSRIDIETTIDNSARDHRLKAVFPTYRDCDEEWAETQFDIVKRNCDIGEFDGWFENPQPEKPQQNLVLVCDQAGGLAVANRGIPEYRISHRPERAIELTLLRCVEWGSRGDLHNTRRGKSVDEAGRAEQSHEFMYLKDAQMQGSYTFNYSIIPLLPADPISDAVVSAYCHKISLKSILWEDNTEARLEECASLMAVSPHDVVVSALKRTRNGDAYLVRLTNWDVSTRNVTLSFIKRVSVEMVDLKENRVPQQNGEVKCNDENNSSWTLKMEGKKIITLRIRCH